MHRLRSLFLLGLLAAVRPVSAGEIEFVEDFVLECHKVGVFPWIDASGLDFRKTCLKSFFLRTLFFEFEFTFLECGLSFLTSTTFNLGTFSCFGFSLRFVIVVGCFPSGMCHGQ